MKKRWFDDWEVTHYFKDKGRRSVVIKLPYSAVDKEIKFKSVTDKRILHLIDLIDCALTELTKKL